ncbi:oligosaccharide flippase family protein [Raoultella ornithinolytica]|nr:oligosaccharide flippase family protein [Raoultella ornithinolytica]
MNKKIVSNALWMMSEKIVSIFGLIFVTSFVAKYVGPEIFGNIALAMSIFQLIQLVSQLGTDVLIFKRLSKNNASGINLINVTVPIRAVVYVVLSAPVLFYQMYFSESDGGYYIFAAFIACFIQSMDVYSIYYDATLNSKVNTFVNVFGLVVSLSVRWLIAFFILNPLWLCLPIVLATFIPAIIRFTYYARTTSRYILPGKYKKKYVKYVIGAGSSFVISSLSVAIYTRLSLLTLGFLDGKSAVGIYSVAATLATSWSFILNSLITSTLPSIFSELKESAAIKKCAKINLIVFFVSLPVICGVFLLGRWFISYFYGESYSLSFYPLLILTFSTMLGAMGTISARLIAKYSGYAFLSKKMLVVAVFSLFINVFFIYFWGIIGAAIANVLTQFVSLTIFNYFFKNGIVFHMHTKTIFYLKKD